MNFSEKLERRTLYSHVREWEDGVLLLDYLSGHFPRLTREQWESEIRSGSVFVNDRSAPPGAPLRKHDKVSCHPAEKPEPPARLSYRIAYRDDDFLVIDKPGDLCVHPSGPFFRHTLWHLVGSDWGEVHFVNRLDRETSGLLLAARNRRAAAEAERPATFPHKEYLALVFGRFSGSLRAKGTLIPDESSSVFKKKKFVPDGVSGEFSDTELRAEHPVGDDMTLVRAALHTGRQHQVRATLYSLGFPLVGDKLYGPDESIFLKIRTQTITPEDWRLLRMPRQALHSALLVFHHPFTGREIRCESPLPDDFLNDSMR